MDKEDNTFTAFESLIIGSAPQSRKRFQNELGQQLKQEFIQRKQSHQLLTAFPLSVNRKHSTRLIGILVALLILGIGSVIAVNVFLKPFLEHDLGLNAIYEQGRGHEINISQTHGNYTVTLLWAYADGNRVTFAYLIEAHVGQYTNLDNWPQTLKLRQSDQEIALYQGRGIPLKDNGEMFTADDYNLLYGSHLNIYTYDLSGIDTQDLTTLDLRLEFGILGVTPEHRTLSPTDFFALVKGTEDQFIFDFSVALSGEQRTFAPNLEATDQSITIRLEQVTVTPSQIKVTVCYPSPDLERQWALIPQFSTSQGEIVGDSVDHAMRDEDVCNYFTFSDALMDYTGEWRLELVELVGMFSGGSADADQMRIAGSWVFEFTLP